MLVKSLQKYGNSYALIIDKALMEATGITPETELQVTVTAGSFVVRASNIGIDPTKLAEAKEVIRTKFGNAMKRLAE